MSFDQMMIRYTAPTLCEIKSGNLFAVKKSDFSLRKFLSWREKLGHFGIRLLAVQARCKNILILAYNVCWVTKFWKTALKNSLQQLKVQSAERKSEFSVLMIGVTVSGCATGQTELNPAEQALPASHLGFTLHLKRLTSISVRNGLRLP